MTAASDLANTLSAALLAGTDFTIDLPDFSSDDFQIPEADENSPIYAGIVRITNADLTAGDGSITGTGTFDLLMRGFRAHLKAEYEAGRITGSEYTKAYIACTESAMSTGAQFLMTRDTTFWAAVTAQLQAQAAQVGIVTARVQLESEKTRLQVLRLEALNQQVAYARNKMGLANENITFDTAKYQLDNILPKNLETLEKAIEREDAQIAVIGKQGVGLDDEHALAPKKLLLMQAQVDAETERTNLVTKQVLQMIAETANEAKRGVALDDEHALQPKRLALLTAQVDAAEQQTLMVEKQVEQLQTEVDLGPQKLALLIKQVASQEAQTNYTLKQTEAVQNDIDLFPIKEQMMQEQAENARAQTMDTRSDGTTVVTGVLGRQKLLYEQQVESYKRDSELKAAKIFSDAWITQKTIDEGLLPPDGFTNTSLDEILTAIKANNGLD